MALEPLAGPFPVLHQGRPVELLPSGYWPFWVDGLGLCGFWRVLGQSQQWYGVVQPDGAAHIRNDNPSGFYYAPLSWDLTRDDLLAGDGYAHLLFDFRALTGNFLPENVSSSMVCPMRLPDRYLIAWRGGLYTTGATAGVADVLELQAVPQADVPIEVDTGFLSPGPKPHLVWMACQPGQLVLYDTVARQLAAFPTGIAMANLGIWYSRRHDCFVSLHQKADGAAELRLWANAPRPAALSTPAPVETPRAGWATPVRARLTGSYGEPCAGHLLQWTLAGGGSLSATQSETDADGWAELRYAAPLSVPAQAPQITAEVLF